MSDDRRLQIPLLQTGVPNLDEILGGGLPELSFTIVAGGPGAGKTTLAHQILFHLGTAERPGLYCSILGEPTVKLLRYQQQFRFFDPNRVGRDLVYLDLAEALQTGGPSRVLDAVSAEVERRSPVLVVFDSLRAVGEASSGVGRGNLRSFTHDLALLLVSWDTTSLLLGEYSPQRFDEEPEFTICDGILWLDQQAQLNSVTRKLQVLKMRGLASLPGRHSFHITRDGLHVYPHLARIVDNPAPPSEGRAAFGVSGLDEMMRGGIPVGEAALIAGSSGTGKTLLALHFAVEGARRGEASVLVTFEERPAAHIRKALGFGWDLRALEAQGLLRTLYLRPVDLSVDEVLGEINAATATVNAKRVIINGISGFDLAIAPRERDEFREGLYRLVASLTSQGKTVLMTTEVLDLFGDVRITTYGISFIADNIILLRYAEIESELRRALTVIKMRTSDHDKELRQYRIGSGGVVVESPFTQYSGILSGIPTLQALVGPQPYTAGLSEDEESLVYVLNALREASAEQLAESLNLPQAQVERTLHKLVDTGYLLRTTREGKVVFRVAMTVPVVRQTRLRRGKDRER